jgi:fumarate reductase subunit C
MTRPIGYVRPMRGWWRVNPFYRWYMLREASCFFVTAYALWLLYGLVCLVRGRAAYDGWRAMLASPWSVAFHAVALAVVLYHAWTWFKVMPKTLPFVRIGGRRVPDRAIVQSGVTAAVVASVMLYVAFMSWSR